ncbi:hypothetical protein, partial [uncultured Alistipes sp.]
CKARGKANEISKFPDDVIHKTRLLAGPSRRLPKPSPPPFSVKIAQADAVPNEFCVIFVGRIRIQKSQYHGNKHAETG